MKTDVVTIKTWTLRAIKTAAVLIGLYLIYAAATVLISGNWTALQKVVSGSSKVIGFCLPYLMILVTKSLLFLWPPILAYMLIGILTTSRWWRFYLCLSALAAAILLLNKFVFSQLDLSFDTLKQVPDIFLYIMQVYLLLLWTVPREVWNFVGGIIFAIQSLIVTVMPDLPTYFDDLGMILAIFTFIFLYINTIASVIQRIIDERVIRRSRQVVATIIKNTPLRKYVFSQQAPSRDSVPAARPPSP